MLVFSSNISCFHKKLDVKAVWKSQPGIKLHRPFAEGFPSIFKKTYGIISIVIQFETFLSHHLYAPGMYIQILLPVIGDQAVEEHSHL